MSVVTPQAKILSLPALRQVLLRYTHGWTWAEDAIQDLWELGAPDPQASFCPMIPQCDKLKCTHVKRILLPTKFAQWWSEVQQRMGIETTAGDIIHGT